MPAPENQAGPQAAAPRYAIRAENLQLTSWPSLKTDIRNAAGNWVDTEAQVCTSGPNTIVSSRKPDDLPAFCEHLVKVFQEQAPSA
jgi:protease I